MEKFVISGGRRLKGEVRISGAKNVALKTLVAACLTDEEVVIENIPLISDLFVMAKIIERLGGRVKIEGHKVRVWANIKSDKIPLDEASLVRTSSMFIAPLLAREGEALVPNPGGCRIGARPIDRIIKGLESLNVNIYYDSDDGYFHASTKELKGGYFKFEKNTHTGTETLILAAVLAQGRTVLENAAQEPEVDELINLLNLMGAKVKRQARKIIIDGVSKLHGAKFTIGPDRNEIVTLAVAGILTGGDILIKNVSRVGLTDFINRIVLVGGGVEKKQDGLRFFYKGKIRPKDVITSFYPGFMTDWQGPWSVLMTQTEGISTIHETVYENRFTYVKELLKIGARIELFNPKVKNPQDFYNFNWADNKDEYFHAIKIYGPTKLHNAVLDITDLRAGATLVLAALAARGESVIYGVEHIDRGYEDFDLRLQKLGANIKRVKD